MLATPIDDTSSIVVRQESGNDESTSEGPTRSVEEDHSDGPNTSVEEASVEEAIGEEASVEEASVSRAVPVWVALCIAPHQTNKTSNLDTDQKAWTSRVSERQFRQMLGQSLHRLSRSVL